MSTTTQKPKLMAGLLIGGIVVLGGGATVAAMLNPASGLTPAARAASAPSSVPAVRATVAALPITPDPDPARSSMTSATSATPAYIPPIAVAAPDPIPGVVVYIVKRGDTLSTIAAWFKLHGYEQLYTANRAAVGSNPDLILPGERISVINGAMSFQPPN